MVKLIEFDGIEIWRNPDAKPWGDGKLYPYSFRLSNQRENCYVFPTIERAVVEAISAKYCGQQGASGTGVDTAAGWFMKMIGAGHEDD